jgi:hypothetical protein
MHGISHPPRGLQPPSSDIIDKLPNAPDTCTPEAFVCTQCCEAKPPDWFSWRKSGPRAGKRESACKACEVKKARDLRAANPELARQKARDRHAANPERRKQQSRNRYAANIERRRQYSRDWYAANPDPHRMRAYRMAQRMQHALIGGGDRPLMLALLLVSGVPRHDIGLYSVSAKMTLSRSLSIGLGAADAIADRPGLPVLSVCPGYPSSTNTFLSVSFTG